MCIYMYRPQDVCAMISHRLLINSYVKFPIRLCTDMHLPL